MARGLTQADLAGSDFTKGFISLVETGRTRISLRAAEIFSLRLGIPASDLIAASDGGSHQSELLILRAEQELSAGRSAAALAAAQAIEPKIRGILRSRARHVRARALIASGRAGEALPLLDRARREFEQFARKDLAARTLFDLARAQEQLDQAGEALHYLLACERALDAGEIVDRTLELQVHRMLSMVYIRLGDFEAAEMRAERAKAIAEEVSDPATLAQLYAGISITRQERGDFEAAITYARRSLDVYAELEQRGAVGRSWNNLAWLYIRRGHHAKADEALGRAEAIAQDLGDAVLAGWAAATRAELLLARGRPADAGDLAANVSSNTALPPRVRAEASLLRARALVARKAPLTDLRRAFEEALRLHRGEPPRLRARVHHEYGQALAERGDTKDAYDQELAAVELLQPRT